MTGHESPGNADRGGHNQEEICIRKEMMKLKIENVLRDYGVDGKCVDVTRGAAVTRYDVQLKNGVRLRKLELLARDIAMAIGAESVSIKAIAGRPNTIGIEVPNSIRSTVNFSEMPRYVNKNGIPIAIGKRIDGKIVTCDLTKMPHLLIAGTTGSGKSVLMNAMICSILEYDIDITLIDPKRVEFSAYKNAMIAVITETDNAVNYLNNIVGEMEQRYEIIESVGARNIDEYNRIWPKAMRKKVIFIDELADLMMTSKKEVEDSIVRIAQKARAVGIHLVVSTQKPTVNVITGLIKSNIPSRIALTVACGTDSRVILDRIGAEKLLGNGDMLYQPIGAMQPIRLQGCYVSGEEIKQIVQKRRNRGKIADDEWQMILKGYNKLMRSHNCHTNFI